MKSKWPTLLQKTSNHLFVDSKLTLINYRRLSEPLQVALAEGEALKRELAHYEKDKLSLQNAKARLKVLEEKYKQSTWEQEVLEQRFAQVQKERDDLYEQFVDRIISVQQKTGFKNLVLSIHVKTHILLQIDFGKEGRKFERES